MEVSFENQSIEISIEGLDDNNSARVTIGDSRREVQGFRASNQELCFRTNGRLIHAYVLELENEKIININGHNYHLAVNGAGGRKGRAAGDQNAGLTPPFPGVVTAVLVGPGDRVVKGQALIKLMAMKMEVTVSAPYNGLVKSVNTKVEAQVMPGDQLIELEKDEQNEQT